MTWFKVDDAFSSHNKVLSIPRGAARLRAVGLWTTAGTWCARHLTDGHIARHMIEELGATKTDATRLVTSGLWETTPTGYVFHDWRDWQPTKEKVENDRAAARERMANNRAKKKPKGTTEQPGSEDVQANEDGTSPGVLVTPSRPVPSNAAAAASRETPLPPPLEILRSHLDAAKLTVRWDKLTDAEITEIEGLVETHGDTALVKSALLEHRPSSPAAFAQAWLGGWRKLRPPGAAIELVADPCPQPGHSGTVRHCVQCASEYLASGESR